MRVDLYDHQIQAIANLSNGKILCGGVGSGKSRTSIAYFFTRVCGGSLPINTNGEFGEMKIPKNLYIITTAKKRDSLDWLGECTVFNLSSDPECSFGGVRVIVDSWNNIKNYTDVTDSFFIFDEQRLVGSGAWVKSFYKIARHNEWILLSATPGDTWMDYLPVLIANGYYQNKKDFTDRHVVFSPFTKYPKIDRYLETQRLEKIRDSLLVEMPFARATTRHVEYIKVDYDPDLWKTVVKKRWNPWDDEPIQEVGKLFYLMRQVSNTHESRYKALLRLLETHPRVVVFYNFNYELRGLLEAVRGIPRPVAQWNGLKHEAIPDGEEWVYLVQYTAGAEGWNCVTTDTEVFFSLNYSYRVLEQAMGRIDRLNTKYTDLYYYILRSGSPIDLAIMKALTNKRNFNERNYLKTEKEDQWGSGISS